MIERIREIYEYRDMIVGLVQRDLRGRYKGSFLGFLWNFVNPLFQIIVYIVVFSEIMENDTPYYVIYLICGMMPWIFFSDSLRQGASSIVLQADMAKKIYFPREVLPLSAVISRFINLIITYILVILFILVSGMGINPVTLVYLLPALLFIFIFALGLTLIFSAINVFFRDVEHILGIVLMAWMWITPIIYEADIIDGTFLSGIIMINPLTYFIKLFHQTLYLQMIPKALDMWWCFAICVVTLILGEIVFGKLSGKFAEEL